MRQNTVQRPKKYQQEIITGDSLQSGGTSRTNPADYPPTAPKLKLSKIAITILVLILVTLGTALVLLLIRNSNPNQLPQEIVGAKPGFTLYYFKDSTPPAAYSLKPDSVSLENGILVFTLTGSGNKTIGISEAAVPAEFTNSTLQGNERFPTAYGNATLSTLEDGRTTGSLKTKDGTLILLNTSDPIELDVLKDMLRSLKPL